jgi:hypothetical protein
MVFEFYRDLRFRSLADFTTVAYSTLAAIQQFELCFCNAVRTARLMFDIIGKGVFNAKSQFPMEE